MSADVISRPPLAASLIVPVGCVVAATVVALWPTLVGLEHYWRTILSYQHAYLIVPIALGWLWQVARPLWWRAERPTWPTAAALLLALFAWLVSFTASISIAQQLLLPVVLWLALLVALRWPVARRFLAPVALLYFAVPIWDSLLPLLQQLSIFVTRGSMMLLGVPATIQGNIVTIPDGVFEIEEGCSGLRFLMIALAVAYLAGAMFHLPRRRVVWLLAFALALALVVNWIRIAIVIYAGYLSHMRSYLVAVEHVSLGNALFLPLLACVLWMARRLSGTRAPPTANVFSLHRPDYRGLIACAAALLAFAGWQLLRTGSVAATATLEPLPLGVGNWQGPLPPRSSWLPNFATATSERRAAYVSAGAAVETYVNFYARQSPEAKLVGYGNSFVPVLGWTRKWGADERPLHVAGRPAPRMVELTGADRRAWLVGHVYRVGGWETGSATAAQLAYGLRSLMRPAPAGAVAFAIQCDPNCEFAQRVATDFWNQMSGPLLDVVPATTRK